MEKIDLTQDPQSIIKDINDKVMTIYCQRTVYKCEFGSRTDEISHYLLEGGGYYDVKSKSYLPKIEIIITP
jgi:hypothetical protein